MSPEKSPRPSRGTRRGIRRQKSTARQTIETAISTDSEAWTAMEALLHLKLRENYPRLKATGDNNILREWFETSIAMRLLPQEDRHEARQGFVARHGRENVAAVSKALKIITEEISGKY